LFPFKDFDFIGKQVVCQKCCKKFASRFSYKAHVDTNICVRTYNGPNPIYLKYKNRKKRRFWKKKKIKSQKDFDDYEIKKNVLNAESLNTLQTRNKVYPDNIIQEQKKIKRNAMNNSNTNNYESSVKKPRERPKKCIISNNVEVNLKKQGRPKKLNAVTVDSSNQNSNSSSSNLEIDEPEEPKKLNNCSLHYAFNKNTNENGNLQSFSSKIEHLSAKFWKLFTKEFNPNVVDIHKYQYPTKCQYNAEKNGDLLTEGNEIFLKIEELENDFKFLFKQFKGKREYLLNNEIELILTKIIEKCDETKQSLLKKTEIKGSIPNKSKENNKRTLRENKNETEIEMNNIDFDKNEKCKRIWIDNSNTVSSITTIKMNDGCKSINHVDKDNSKKGPTSQDSLKDFKTLTVIGFPNIFNSVRNRLDDLGSNYILNPTLNCKKCKKKFTSTAEQKLHFFKHQAKINKSFLCTFCGHKFKIYKNFRKHVNIHKKLILI